MRNRQPALFEFKNRRNSKNINYGGKKLHKAYHLSDKEIIRVREYDLDAYIYDVEHLGLEKTWDILCQYVISYNENIPDFINVTNFGELYEIGLAIRNKIQKKKSGQYCTPDDVANVMSCWLQKSNGNAVCDVACGTGKLILTYLSSIGYEKARTLINDGNLYLYDFDNVALKICRTAIGVTYGLDIVDKIHDIFCDFMDPNIKLPRNAKVISNPPYAKIENIPEYWDGTEVLTDTKEYYSVFMEKIISQARSAVIITPFSFISGKKFYSLRRQMCETGTGFIVSFDNVPGNIFCGRKHGIFNTNTSNSVRAAITVITSNEDTKGFKVSPLIRFKNEERAKLLKTNVLEKTLPSRLQIVDENVKVFEKVDKSLESVLDTWKSLSEQKIRNVVSDNESKFLIDMPNTCRYYTTAAHRKLNRTGSITVYIEDKDTFNFVYCLINSSFTYWWWRIYDGGITYPSSLFYNMPVPLKMLTNSDREFFQKTTDEMISVEDDYIATKVNAGDLQENIKFPEKYRRSIDNRILKMLRSSVDSSIFDSVRANKYF